MFNLKAKGQPGLLTAHTERKLRWRSRCPAPESCRLCPPGRAAPRPPLDWGPGDTTSAAWAPAEKLLHHQRHRHLPRPWPQPFKPGPTTHRQKPPPPLQARQKKEGENNPSRREKRGEPGVEGIPTEKSGDGTASCPFFCFCKSSAVWGCFPSVPERHNTLLFCFPVPRKSGVCKSTVAAQRN